MTHLPPNEQTPPTEDPRDDPPPEEAPQREALSEKSLLKRGEEEVQEIIEEVARETEPRWRMLRRGRFWLAIYLIVLLLVLLLALAAHLFSVLPGDLPLTREFQEERNPILYNVMYYVSYIGFFWPATIITVVVVLALAVVRLRLEACFVVVSLLGDAVDGAIKLIVARQRPSANLVIVVQHLSDFSFPSGHTVHYTVFYGFLAFLLFTNFRASWGRNLLIGVCVALVVLVGPSRVYLGEHWPTDVLGGYLIGGLCLAPLIAGYLWVKARYDLTRRPPWLKRRANGGPGSAP